MNYYKCHLFPFVLNANNHTYSKSLRKVIIKYFYLLPSSLKAVLRLPLQCILLKITVSYSFLETELNLVLFWFSCSSHQLFHPFIVGTSKDSNLGCMHAYLFLFSLFQKMDSFCCFSDHPCAYNAQPLLLHPVLLSFLNSSFKCLPHSVHLFITLDF